MKKRIKGSVVEEEEEEAQTLKIATITTTIYHSHSLLICLPTNKQTNDEYIKSTLECSWVHTFATSSVIERMLWSEHI